MISAEVSPAQDAAWQATLAEFRRTGLLPAHPRLRANERLEAEITELWGNLNAATYRFLELIAEYDRTGGWKWHGLANCAHWLNWQCGIGKLAAREKVRVARALEQLPRISASFARGEISYSKVRAMTRIATPENESDLLNVALYGTASHVEKLVRQYRRVERLREAEQAHELHRMRRLRFFYDEDGSMIIHAKLPAEVGAVVKKAIEAAVEALEHDEEAAREPQRQAAPDRESESASERAASNRTGAPSDSTGAPSGSTWTQADRDGIQPSRIWTGSNVSAETAGSETVTSSEPYIGARAPALRRVETPEERYEREHQREHPTFHDSYGARRADALAHLAECFLARQTQARGSVADRYQVVVHVDQRLLASQPERSPAREPGSDLFAATPRHLLSAAPQRCELGEEHETKRALAVETVRRLGCDCSVVGIVENADGEPLSVGRKTRSIPPALQRALEARDGGCRYPGCVRTRYCHAHHVVHWANGGETKLSNLLTLCVFHHRLVHEGGYGVHRADNGEFVFTRPDGSRVEPNGNRVVSAAGTVEGRSAGGQPALFEVNRARGLEIDAGTSRCRWDGGPMDYSMAIEGLWRYRETHEARNARDAGDARESPRNHASGAGSGQSVTAPASELVVPGGEPTEPSEGSTGLAMLDGWEEARIRMLVDLVEKLDLADDEEMLAALGLTRDDLGGDVAGSHQRS